MAERYVRPDWVRRLNAMGLACGGAHRAVPLEAGELIDHARASTGVDQPAELGDGDWEGRLRALVEAIDEGDLHVVGRLMTREEILRGLRTRLALGDQRRRDPSVAEEAIDAPIVVTGPARSGTTILFELLGLDPGVRTPVATDVMHPVPPPGTSPQLVTSMTEAEQELWADVQPEFAGMHELRSDLPVESITISMPSFAGNHWAMILDDLGGWAPDVSADLAFHRSVLQAVQHGEPARRWLLKTPGFLMMMDDLLAAHPDACIIQTHRDPAKTMPSTVSTVAMIRWLRSDRIDLSTVSALVGAVFADALTTVSRRRDDGSLQAPFGDLRFRDLMSDPVAAIEGAYEGIGREMSDEHRDAVVEYLAAKPRGKHGEHRYTPEEWGFDTDALHAELAEYMARFDVAVEA